MKIYTTLLALVLAVGFSSSFAQPQRTSFVPVMSASEDVSEDDHDAAKKVLKAKAIKNYQDDKESS